MEEIFAKAGLKDGIEVWRIENLQLVPVASKYHGSFFRGDSYIILSTEDSGKFMNLHFWIGSQSSQDEYCAAAILARDFDQAKDDKPVQYRETEGYESKQFLSYFEQGVKYKLGGVASGAKHVITNQDDEVRLLRVKGRGRKITSSQVAFNWSSIFNDDVYIFEIGSDIYRWRGSGANMFEWLQSAHVANHILSEEQMGRGKIHQMDEGDDWPEDILAALGAAPDKFTESGEDDSQKHVKITEPSLFKISMDTGSMETTKVATGKNVDPAILETDDVYMLDASDAQPPCIYMWKGETALVSEKKEAMAQALGYIKSAGYNPATNIVVFNEGREPKAFKKYFNW